MPSLYPSNENTERVVENALPGPAEHSSQAPWADFGLIFLGSAALLLILATSQWLGFLGPLRLVLALIFILFVPGYCLAAALFPRRGDLDGIERLGMSVGLSIAWAAVLALSLNALPWGLREWPVILGDLASIMLACGVAFWRRRRLPAAQVFALRLAWNPRAGWQSLPLAARRGYGSITIALALAALGLAWTFLAPPPVQSTTEFYMLGPQGSAENLPRQAAIGQPVGVTLGVANLEPTAHTYRVEVYAADLWPQGQRKLLLKEGPYTLASGDRREWPVTWEMPWAGDNQVVELLLFDGDDTTSYRTLRLVLNVTL